MNFEHIVNAWRDEEYCDGLDQGERAVLPENPIGEIDLIDVELDGVEGGTGSWTLSLIQFTLRYSCF
jgi:mersacidin/lichenicidin family type 2 lantibiotic